ncbi:MAG TPA: DNRLRE domain-containing protein, partial [Candidatus Korarchaeota archaeon]|nr:DNRLRE domain-containing protein [Candidatus Korarchaeota archaeon]
MRRALSPCLALSLVVLLVLPLQLVEAAPSAVEVEIAVDVYIDTYDGELDLSISDPDLNFKRGADSTLIVGKRKESVEYGRTAFTDDWHEGCGILDAECVGMVGANEYRILLRPSLDGISGLVTSAKIVLTLKQMDPDHDVAILAYPLTANFNEAEATWIYRDSGVGWTNEGGDYDSSSLLDQVVVQAGSPPGTTVEIDVTDYVRSVRQGSSENYGVILVPGATRGWAEFYSTESSNPEGRPKLVVELATVGPPAPPTTVPGTQPPVGGIGPVTPKTWYVTLSPSQASLTQGEAVEIE